jgi:hypothetical protein
MCAMSATKYLAEIRASLKDPLVKRNNKIAVIAHLLLTVLGLVIYLSAVQGIFRHAAIVNEVEYIGFPGIDVLLTLIFGAIAYIYVGYAALKPTSKKAILSVFFLLQITVFTMVMMVLVRILSPLAVALSEGSFLMLVLAIFAAPFPLLFNAPGMGVLYLAVHLELPILVENVLILAVALLPPGLMCLGYCLKQHHPNSVKTTSSVQHIDNSEEKHSQGWLNSSCENFNWEE